MPKPWAQHHCFGARYEGFLGVSRTFCCSGHAWPYIWPYSQLWHCLFCQETFQFEDAWLWVNLPFFFFLYLHSFYSFCCICYIVLLPNLQNDISTKEPPILWVGWIISWSFHQFQTAIICWGTSLGPNVLAFISFTDNFSWLWS